MENSISRSYAYRLLKKNKELFLKRNPYLHEIKYHIYKIKEKTFSLCYDENDNLVECKDKEYFYFWNVEVYYYFDEKDRISYGIKSGNLESDFINELFFGTSYHSKNEIEKDIEVFHLKWKLEKELKVNDKKERRVKV